MRKEIRITGYGGQGVILSAYVLGKALTLYEGLHATMTQSFGPEARGSACSAQLVVSDKPIDYPYVRKVDYLIVMSQEGFEKYVNTLKEDGILITEKDLVKLGKYKNRANTFSVPSTRIAEKLGRRIVSNMAMLGFVSAVTDLVSKDSLRKAIETSVPEGTQELNLKAFEGGYGYHKEKESVSSGRGNSGDTSSS